MRTVKRRHQIERDMLDLHLNDAGRDAAEYLLVGSSLYP